MKHQVVFTLIRPSATFSLREKEPSAASLANPVWRVAGASWSAAVPGAFGDCKKENMEEQDGYEIFLTTKDTKKKRHGFEKLKTEQV